MALHINVDPITKKEGRYIQRPRVQQGEEKHLGGLAEFERHLILTRTVEGRTRAQANGVRFGRKPSLTAYQRAEHYVPR